MPSFSERPLLVRILGNRNVQFWSLQFAGWLGISLVSFLSLNLWYNQPEFSYIAHNLLQSLLGMLLSWPMRPIFNRVWEIKPIQRFSFILIAVLFFSLLWSVLRLLLFLALTDETNVWSDFGGWLFPSIFIFLCWTALFHGIKYYQLLEKEHQIRLELAASQKLESLRRTEAESLTRQAQLEMLRYQLNPHFLFNTMNSIASLVASHQNSKAHEMILQLSDFLRYSLSSGRKSEVLLADEVEALYKYLQIEQSRFGDRLKLDVDLKPGSHNCLLPGLLLQPLVENAIKYAIAPSENGGVIRITAQVVDNILKIEIEDSGTDVDDKTVPEGTGVGLKNVKERLETLFDKDFSLEYSKSILGGRRATVIIPVKLERDVMK